MNAEYPDWRGLVRRHWHVIAIIRARWDFSVRRGSLRIPMVREQRSIIGHGPVDPGSLDNGKSRDFHSVRCPLGTSVDWSPDSNSRRHRMAVVEKDS